MNMRSYRLAGWKQVFVEMASWLMLFRIDLKKNVRFRTEGIVITRFRVKYIISGLWRIAWFRTVGIFTCTFPNRFTSSNAVFVQIASWHTLFRIDLYLFVRFYTEDIMIIRFNVIYLCFRIGLWRVACFLTAGLLTFMLSNRFSRWNFVFLQTPSSLEPFVVDL